MFSMHRLPCWKARQWDNTGAVHKHKQVEMRINYAHSILNSQIANTTLIQYFKLDTEREQLSKKISNLAICKFKFRNCNRHLWL